MRIGIFGGTFDPPHFAHLIIAEEVLHAYSLDKVWFMPSYIPPHKLGQKITPICHRVEMVRKAIAGNPNFDLSLMECERERPSFTYNTVKELKDRYPNDQFFFLVGGDMVKNLPKWHRAEELVQIVTIVGVRRPGFTMSSVFKDRIHEVEAPAFDISSSFLRERFKKNESTRYFLPDEVRYYIVKKGLYGPG